MKKIGPFPGDVKPVREGIYQCVYTKSIRLWSYWNGSYWGSMESVPDIAWKYRDFRNGYQDLPWYGIEKPQHERKTS